MNGLKRSVSSSSIPILKKDGNSNIPVLKREGSSHSLSKRESRIAVRQSRTSEARARQTQQKRSSKSVDRFSYKATTPLLTNRLRPSTQTPLTLSNTRKIRSSSKSPILSAVSVKKVDKRPINDKDWQKQQLIKVQNFLYTRFQITEKIKAGLSIEMFVSVTQVLFKSLDERINITKENYVEEVPARLKCYRYPSAVKPSLMKTVNVPHSWSNIIAILSWLVDLIEKLDNLKGDIPFEPESGNLRDIQIFFAKFKANLNLVAMCENNEDVDVLKEYEADLRDIFQLNEKEVEKCKDEVNLLRKKVENLVAQEADVLKINEEHKSKIAIVAKNIEDLNSNLQINQEYVKKMQEEIIDRNDKIEKKREKLIESIKTLKEQITSQPYTTKDRKDLLQKLEELKFTRDLKEERLKELKEISDTNDLKLAENRRTVQTIVNKINNVLKDLKRIKPDFGMETLRETKFTDPEFLYEIEEFKKRFEDEKRENIKELQVLEEYYQKMLDVKNEIVKKYDVLAKEVRQVESKADEAQRVAYEAECIQKLEMQSLTKKLEAVTLELENHDERFKGLKEKITHLKEQLDETLCKKKEELESLVKEQEESLLVIGKACTSVIKNREKERELLTSITQRICEDDISLSNQIHEFYENLQKTSEELKTAYNKII